MTTCATFNEQTTAYGDTTLKDAKYLTHYRNRLVHPIEEEVLGEGLNALPLKARQRAFEDVDGVDNTPIEVKSFVDSCMASLEEEIEKIKGEIRAAYDLAMSMDRQYVQNNTFRLMFLRADTFSAQKAAQRMMKHFEVKLALFGKEKLVKDIMFDDLGEEDQITVSTGSHQSLFKDVKGRTLLFIFPELFKAHCVENFLRAQWYHYMVALEEPSTQRHGFVIVPMGVHKARFIEMSLTSQRTILPALPARPAAFHFCLVNDTCSPYLKIMLDMLGTSFKGRFRLHLEDSAISCLSALQSYGINPATVPIEHDSRPNTTMFLEYLEKRKLLERQRRDGEGILNSCSEKKQRRNGEIMNGSLKNYTTRVSTCGISPSRWDILLGQGLKHHGNYKLDNLINSQIITYMNARSKFQKSCIVLATVKDIEASGGRFLKRGRHKEWLVADPNTVRETIGTRFRNKMRKMTNTKTLC